MQSWITTLPHFDVFSTEIMLQCHFYLQHKQQQQQL